MTDVWWPGAERHAVALRQSQQREIRPAGLVCHTAVSNSAKLVPSGEVRWHFYVNKDGKAYQFFPVNRPAAAQLDGNYWTESGTGWGFISVETWDGAGTSVWPDYNRNPSGGPAWTAAQLETLARLAAWLHTEHGVPLKLADGPQGRGIGYHRQFTGKKAPRWNESHACPGTKRIAQVPEIIKRAKALVEGDDELSGKADEILKKLAEHDAKLAEARRALGERHNLRRKEYLALLENIQQNENHLIYARESLLKPAIAKVGQLETTAAEMKAAIADLSDRVAKVDELAATLAEVKAAVATLLKTRQTGGEG